MYPIGKKKKMLKGNSDKYRIGIFKEQDFPSQGIPKKLTLDWLKNVLEKEEDNFVIFLDARELMTYSLMSSELIDMVILPYGEVFPMYSFKVLKSYFQNGGNLLTTAGRPFWKPMRKEGDTWNLVKKINSYDRFLAELGIKYYEAEDEPFNYLLDKDIFPECPKNTGWSGFSIGLTLTTSDEYALPAPPLGNVFPERIPTCDFQAVMKGIDKFGKTLTSSVVIAKNWQNGSKWCLIGISGENHPLNPDWKFSSNFLKAVVNQLRSSLMLYELHPNYACYRQGESVNLSVNVKNFSKKNKDVKLKFIVSCDDKEAKRLERPITLKGKQETKILATWTPNHFQSDLYQIEAVLIEGENIVSKTRNGFVVWDEKILKSGPSVKTKGYYFDIDGNSSVITGVNYYESIIGELMWLKPNVLRLAEDFKQMGEMGINYIRPHYHHSKWFRDYMKYVNRGAVPEYFDIADTSPLPSERTLRIFDAIIQLSQKNGLVYGGDLFTLVPVEMGDPRGWILVFERCYDPEKIKVQIEFLKILAKRYKDVPGISWDLWNEPSDFFVEELRKWAEELKNVLKVVGDKHPITVGGNVSAKLEQAVDYISYHGFDLQIKDMKKPFFFQEIWMDQGCSLEEELKQRDRLMENFHTVLKLGGAGFAPWSWTRQARLWNNNKQFSGERWDDELGCCVRADATVKPAGQAYRDLIALITSIKIVEKIEKGRLKTSVGELRVDPEEKKIANFWTTDRCRILHVNGKKIFMGEFFNYLNCEKEQIIKTKVKKEGDVLVMVFSKDGSDIRESKEVYLKINTCGILEFKREIKGIPTASIVETNGRESRTIAQKQINLNKNWIVINIEPYETDYWIRLITKS